MNHPTLFLTAVLAVAAPIATAGPAPTIKAIWPGAYLDAMRITVVGANLTGATRVTIGGAPAQFEVKGGVIHAWVLTDQVSGRVEVDTPNGKVVSKDWVQGPPGGFEGWE